MRLKIFFTYLKDVLFLCFCDLFISFTHFALRFLAFFSFFQCLVSSLHVSDTNAYLSYELQNIIFSCIICLLISVPGFPPLPLQVSASGYHISLSHHVSLSSPWLWQFLKFPLFLMNFSVLRSINQVFCRMSFTWELSYYFSCDHTGVIVFLEKDHRGKMSFGHVLSGVNSLTWLFTFQQMMYRCWSPASSCAVLTFSEVKLLFFPFVFIIYCLEGSGGLYHTSFSVEYSHKLLGILHRFFYLLTQSVFIINMNSWLVIFFFTYYSPVLPYYFVAQIVCSSLVIK